MLFAKTLFTYKSILLLFLIIFKVNALFLSKVTPVNTLSVVQSQLPFLRYTKPKVVPVILFKEVPSVPSALAYKNIPLLPFNNAIPIFPNFSPLTFPSTLNVAERLNTGELSLTNPMGFSSVLAFVKVTLLWA